MKKYLILFLFVIIGCVSGFSQKVTVTKPSVAELISVLDSKKPVLTLDQVAAKNGFKLSSQGYGLYKYVKFINSSSKIYIDMKLLNNGLANHVLINSNTKSVVDSWASQLIKLGYVLERSEGDGFEKRWYYSRPAGYSISIGKMGTEYDLCIIR
ncbi:MAG: hypothetical protein K2H18_04565 [Muribaculaceae bacterium]|nr:hypothetical protein [Muribaculaceae bacterium]